MSAPVIDKKVANQVVVVYFFQWNRPCIDKFGIVDLANMLCGRSEDAYRTLKFVIPTDSDRIPTTSGQDSWVIRTLANRPPLIGYYSLLCPVIFTKSTAESRLS